MSEILYHIHKKGFYDELWKEGNELEIGNQNNTFINISLNFSSSINVGNEIFSFWYVYNNFLNNWDIDTKMRLLNDANIFINEYQILIRELGMEQVRKERFIDLPSRFKCIWFCRKDQINYWKNFVTGDIEIFEVEVFDKAFKSRDSLIPLKMDSYNTILEKSFKYWGKNSSEENKDDEYLYVGKMKILKKIEAY